MTTSHSLVFGLLDDRGDDVVGLEAGHVERDDAKRLDDLADEPHLLAQDVGGGGAVGLVVGDGLVAERRLGPVEGGDDAVGPVVAQQVDQHRREPEHGVGDLTGRRGHVGRQGEEGPVRQRVAVEQQQLYGAIRRRPPWCTGSQRRRSAARRSLGDAAGR